MPEIGERHHTSHENGGNDEIDISGLTGATEIEDSPVNGHTTIGISSNWAYDHAANKDAHHVVFVDRGDPTAADFAVADLTQDNAWHDLDLSSIVPAGAIAVLIMVDWLISTVGHLFNMRKNGNTNAFNVGRIRPQVADSWSASEIIVSLDSNRVVEYLATSAVFGGLSLTVRGWWI